MTTDDGRRPTPLPRKNCNHLAPNWDTFDAVCDDGRRPTALQRRATGDGRRTTDDGRRTTDDGRRTTARGTPATDDGRRLRPTITTTTATTTTSTNRSHSRSTDATTTENDHHFRRSLVDFGGRKTAPTFRARKRTHPEKTYGPVFSGRVRFLARIPGAKQGPLLFKLKYVFWVLFCEIPVGQAPGSHLLHAATSS